MSKVNHNRIRLAQLNKQEPVCIGCGKVIRKKHKWATIKLLKGQASGHLDSDNIRPTIYVHSHVSCM